MSNSYPLYQIFIRRILAAIVALIFILVSLTLLNTRDFVEKLYLNLATERADFLVNQISADIPEIWTALVKQRDPASFYSTEQGQNILERIQRVQTDHRTERFKLYSPERILIYSPDQSTVGQYETDPRLDPLFRNQKALLLAKSQSAENELYVPLFDDQQQMIGAIELYESESYLNQLLLETYLPTLLIPTLLFIALTLYIGRVMKRAQMDIDRMSGKLKDTQERLREFVSLNTFKAANLEQKTSDIQPTRRATTIFYSDIRAFTSLVDEVPPTQVVSFLNEVMALQIDIIQSLNGDVDKLIGDAVLAQFDGTDGERRAVEAAKRIQSEIAQRDFPRGIGIGIYSGDVLECAVGSDKRRDFTIIGDTVNLSARLCGAALQNEILVEERTLRRSGDALNEYAPMESLIVKGHEHPISLRRWIKS